MACWSRFDVGSEYVKNYYLGVKYVLYTYIYRGIILNISRILQMFYVFLVIQGDQNVSVHLMITIQKSGSHRIFDHPVHTSTCSSSYNFSRQQTKNYYLHCSVYRKQANLFPAVPPGKFSIRSVLTEMIV